MDPSPFKHGVGEIAGADGLQQGLGYVRTRYGGKRRLTPEENWQVCACLVGRLCDVWRCSVMWLWLSSCECLCAVQLTHGGTRIKGIRGPSRVGQKAANEAEGCMYDAGLEVSHEVIRESSFRIPKLVCRHRLVW